MKEQLQNICKEITSFFQVEFVSIYIREGDNLVCRASSFDDNNLINSIIYKIGEGLTGTIFKDNTSRIIKNSHELRESYVWKGKYDHIQWNDGKNIFRNLLAVPISNDGDTIGVVKLENKIGGTFTQNDQSLLVKYISDRINIFLSCGQQYSKIEDLYTDKIITTDSIKIPSSIIKVNQENWKDVLKLLSQKPQSIYSLTPRRFEELIAEILSRQGFKVTLTGQTRDGGRDILAQNSNLFGEHLYLVECKKYSKNNPVGVSLVRQLYGVIEADKATAGIICTTSQFTNDACKFADNIKHRMSLKNYSDIQAWINNLI